MKINKIIFLLICLLTTFSYSQTWKFESGKDSFDGNYRTSYVVGKSDFPYDKPILSINIFNEKDMNFYISSSGYYPTEDDVKVLLKFNNETNTIYTSNYISLSKDKKTIFLYYFKDDKNQDYSRHDIIEKIKKASNLRVRIITDFGDKDLYFSLVGSSKSIDYIYSDEYLKILEAKKAKRKLIQEKQKRISDSINYIIEQQKLEHQKKELLLKGVLINANIVESEIDKAMEILKYRKDNNKLQIYNIRKINIYINSLGFLAFEIYDTDENLMDSFPVELPKTFKEIKR